VVVFGAVEAVGVVVVVVVELSDHPLLVLVLLLLHPARNACACMNNKINKQMHAYEQDVGEQWSRT